MNYYNTLIEVAEDCPVVKAEVPQSKGDRKTKPMLEYEMIANHPNEYTEEDVAFETYALMHEIPRADWSKARQEFLSKGQPCLRVSALAKRYGWGIYNDGEGKTSLVAVESSEYQRFVNDPKTAKTKALRSSRA